MKLNLEQAETLVQSNKNVFWNGWDLVFVNTSVDGFTKKAGIWHEGQWSVKSVIKLSTNGEYNVPGKYLKSS